MGGGSVGEPGSQFRPRGVTFTAEGMDEFAPSLDPKTDLSYGKFAKIFTSHGVKPVSKEEHTIFLWYWLCYSLFCTRSQKMNRDFLLIVVALANGQKIAFGLYFHAFLY